MAKFMKYPLYQVTKYLSAVAMGTRAADTVIKNASVVNVCTHEIMNNTDVAIAYGRIALLGNASHCIGKDTVLIDGTGKYLAPGLLDGHMHVESSMMDVCEYAKAVIPHGTVGIYMDPHEMCNVLGLDGVKCMMADAANTPLKAMLTTPSCVPAVPGFEDTGSSIDHNDIAETMTWDTCVGLGEMMNYPGILSSNEETHNIVDETLKSKKIPTGHYSIQETGKGLNAYVAAGIRCCHESTRAEDAIAKMRLGMYAQLREGSAWHDLHEVAKAITKNVIDTRFACLISDDTHPSTLYSQGHMDHIIRRAVEEGIDVMTAIQMATINTAQCFMMDNDLGSVTPGKCADIILLDDLEHFIVDTVLIDGDIVAQKGKMTIDVPKYIYPDWATNTIHIKDKITSDIFKIAAPSDEKVKIRVIEVIPAKVGTVENIVEMSPHKGTIVSDTTRDILKAVVFERHHNTGKIGYGFVKGFGIKKGAMASTVAHDAHNLLVVGSNDEDMALAANTLIRSKGGMVVVCDGKILKLVELPIAGLMNTISLKESSTSVKALEEAWKKIGCTMPSPFMTMALIPLACLPDLRLTDRGLVDCRTFKFVDLIVK